MNEFTTALSALSEAHLGAIAELEEEVRRGQKRIAWLEQKADGARIDGAPDIQPAHRYGEPDELGRVPLTPEEFSHSCNSLALILQAAGINTAITSMMRNEEVNQLSGATPQSKHRCRPMIATDYSMSVNGHVMESEINIKMALGYAHDLGLWATYHDTGSGPHLHTQGLPVGQINAQWLEDFATPETKAWAAEVYG